MSVSILGCGETKKKAKASTKHLRHSYYPAAWDLDKFQRKVWRMAMRSLF